MFAIVSTKPLNDNTKGFRFNVLGRKGLVRKRKTLSRGLGKTVGPCTTAYHIFKTSVYVEHKGTSRLFHHFAG